MRRLELTADHCCVPAFTLDDEASPEGMYRTHSFKKWKMDGQLYRDSNHSVGSCT